MADGSADAPSTSGLFTTILCFSAQMFLLK